MPAFLAVILRGILTKVVVPVGKFVGVNILLPLFMKWINGLIENYKLKKQLKAEQAKDQAKIDAYQKNPSDDTFRDRA